MVSVLSALVLIGGCGSEESEPAIPESSIPQLSIAPPVTVADGTEFASGVSLVPGSGFGASAWPTGGDECGSFGRIVTDNADDSIEIAMWSINCVITEGLNGKLQRYNSPADVADPNEVASKRVTAGTASVFYQTYTECTNSCSDTLHRIVLIELDEPIDSALPTVMISTLSGTSVEELLKIADAVRIEA
jgi:hypothetical protein